MSPTFRCTYCGFITDDFQKMDTHISSRGHSLERVEDNKEQEGKTVEEATGIPENQDIVGRGSSDTVEGAKDTMDDVEQNTDETVP